MKEIKKVKPASLAKLIGFFYGIIGFVMSFFVSAMVVFNIVAQKDFLGSTAAVAVFNLGAALILGIIVFCFMGFFGWALGYAVGWIYNKFAARFGGIRIELEDSNEFLNK